MSNLLYVGDTDNKFAYFDQPGLTALGVTVDEHGKMPDVIVHHTSKNWLILIEAVTSHGPVNAKRHEELKRLFRDSSAGLVFVTTFLTRKAFAPYAADISWETEVWFADSPDPPYSLQWDRGLCRPLLILPERKPYAPSDVPAGTF